jgi:hypothetical protein
MIDAIMKVVPSPHLPGEVIDDIVKYLLPDRQTVASCALISKAWVPWSRSYIFSDIQLIGSRHQKANIHFLVLLTSPLCTFLPFVRRLSFDGRFLLIRGDHSLLMNALNSKRTRSDHKNGGIRSFFRKAKESMAKAISSRDDPQSHVMNLVRLLPSVEHLQIDLQLYASKVAECTTLPLVSPTLHSLTVICRTLSSDSDQPREWTNFLHWVHRERVFNITTLRIWGFSACSARGVDALLGAQGNRTR